MVPAGSCVEGALVPPTTRQNGKGSRACMTFALRSGHRPRGQLHVVRQLPARRLRGRSKCCAPAAVMLLVLPRASREERGTDIRHSAPLPLHIRGHGPPAIRNNTWRYRHHHCRDACATHSDDNSCRRLSPWNAATAGGRCFSHHRGAKRSHVGVIDRSERASGHAADPAMSLQSKLALLSHDSVLVQRFRVPGERAIASQLPIPTLRLTHAVFDPGLPWHSG